MNPLCAQIPSCVLLPNSCKTQNFLPSLLTPDLIFLNNASSWGSWGVPFFLKKKKKPEKNCSPSEIMQVYNYIAINVPVQLSQRCSLYLNIYYLRRFLKGLPHSAFFTFLKICLVIFLDHSQFIHIKISYEELTSWKASLDHFIKSRDHFIKIPKIHVVNMQTRFRRSRFSMLN